MVKKLDYLDGTKVCTSCKECKPLSEFSKRKYPSGHETVISHCRICKSKSGSIWNKNNRDKTRISNLRSYYNNLDKRLSDKERSLRNERSKEYYKRNPNKSREATAKKKARKLLATPIWANTSKISAIYLQAKLLEENTGIKYHVDHRVPLQSRYVCGLHVEYNLAVLTAKENCSKHNKFWENMPNLKDKDLQKLAKEFYAKAF